MKAIWSGAVIAESDATVVVEGTHYFPPSSVKQEHLRPSETQSTCGWKGVANYCHVAVGDAVNDDAVWFYPDAKEKAKSFEGYYAFWRGVEIVE